MLKMSLRTISLIYIMCLIALASLIFFTYQGKDYVDVVSNNIELDCNSKKKSKLRVTIEGNLELRTLKKIDAKLCNELLYSNVSEISGSYEKDEYFFGELEIDGNKITSKEDILFLNQLSFFFWALVILILHAWVYRSQINRVD